MSNFGTSTIFYVGEIWSIRSISSKVISMAEQNRILFIDNRYHKENNHRGSNCPILKLVQYLTQKMVRNLKKNILIICYCSILKITLSIGFTFVYTLWRTKMIKTINLRHLVARFKVTSMNKFNQDVLPKILAFYNKYVHFF